MIRPALAAVVAACAFASCTEDVGPITKTWSDTLAGLEGQVSELTRATNELKARTAFSGRPDENDPQAKTLLETVGTGITAAEKNLEQTNQALTAAIASVQAAIQKGRVSGVKSAIEQASSTVGAALETSRTHLKSLEASVIALGKHFEAKEAEARVTAETEASKRAPAVDPHNTTFGDYPGIRFKPGTDQLETDASTTENLAAMVTVLNTCADLGVDIEGHTSVAGDAAQNKALSAKRAQAVTRHLINVGKVSPSKVKKTFGSGGDQPLMPEPAADSDDAKALGESGLTVARLRNERIRLHVVKPCVDKGP